MVAIIGSEGSMGKRYQAILNHLGVAFQALDIRKYNSTTESMLKKAALCERILLCTPTETHVDYLREVLPMRKPVLCEKPITKNLEELIELNAECVRSGWNYQMVMQYQEYDISRAPDKFSYYNYFRHGNDGLAWDCLQTLALANSEVKLSEDSPFWDCVINGRRLSIDGMDTAYVMHVQKWLNNALTQNLKDILDAHRKVYRYLERIDGSADRDSSKIKLN